LKNTKQTFIVQTIRWEWLFFRSGSQYNDFGEERRNLCFRIGFSCWKVYKNVI